MGEHNLLDLLDAGLVVTVNSDDPAYFGGYMNDNFLAAFDALPLDAAHARSWRATASPPPSSTAKRSAASSTKSTASSANPPQPRHDTPC